MKRCDRCGNENGDQMQFCLQCGNVLPAAPIVVNLQNDPAQKPTEAKTDNYNQSAATQVGFNRNTQSGYSAPPVNNPPRSNKGKIFLAVGGVLALLVLFFVAIGAIVAYNVFSTQKAQLNPTPTATPAPTRATDKNSPTPATTPKNSPSDTNQTTDDTETEDPNVTVDFDGVNVAYNVRDGGRSGMRITSNFTVNGMKESDSYLAIHFQTKDGDPLLAKQGSYRDVKGKLAAFKSLKPKFDKTEYKDLEVFMPYDEFTLPAGRHDLRMDIDLLDGKGLLVKHMSFEDFWFESK